MRGKQAKQHANTYSSAARSFWDSTASAARRFSISFSAMPLHSMQHAACRAALHMCCGTHTAATAVRHSQRALQLGTCACGCNLHRETSGVVKYKKAIRLHTSFHRTRHQSVHLCCFRFLQRSDAHNARRTAESQYHAVITALQIAVSHAENSPFQLRKSTLMSPHT
jgi:hypothetical protein